MFWGLFPCESTGFYPLFRGWCSVRGACGDGGEGDIMEDAKDMTERECHGVVVTFFT